MQTCRPASGGGGGGWCDPRVLVTPHWDACPHRQTLCLLRSHSQSTTRHLLKVLILSTNTHSHTHTHNLVVFLISFILFYDFNLFMFSLPASSRSINNEHVLACDYILCVWWACALALAGTHHRCLGAVNSWCSFAQPNLCYLLFYLACSVSGQRELSWGECVCVFV